MNTALYNALADTKVSKGRDGWEAVTMIHIPGRPEQAKAGDPDRKPTHVRIHTGKASRGGLYTSASEITSTDFGFESVIDFHKPEPWERLGESKDRCTEKSVTLLHTLCLAKLKELRPELFDPLAHIQKMDPEAYAVDLTQTNVAVQPEDRERFAYEEHTLWIGSVNGEWGVWDNKPGHEGFNLLAECNSQHHAEQVRDQLEAEANERIAATDLGRKEPDAAGQDEDEDDAGRFTDRVLVEG